MNIKKYKAATPEETVKRIRGILADNMIPVKDVVYGDGDLFCSYRLSIARDGEEDYTIGTNGKGMTPQYAQASAYAEMMERFQNRVVIYPNPANLESACMYFPDETKVRLDAAETAAVVRKFTPRVFPESGVDDCDFDCVFLPFYHVNAGEEAMLPYSLIRWVNGSNGMCAGNIPEEALIQGFNEIFERYVLQEMYLRRLTPPDIPVEIFAGTAIFEHLERMRNEHGMDYRIKDCSLGEGFPVVGLVVYNRDKSKYIAHYGADLSLTVALERCFTEVFQGHTADTLPFDNNMNACEALDLFNEFKRSLVYGRGRMPAEFFGDTPSYDFDTGKRIPEGGDFREDLHNIVEWLKRRHNDIYIRDNSFLGFPTYHICVPGLSDMDKSFCNLNARIADRQAAENNINPLSRLPLLDDEKLRLAVKMLESNDKEAISLAPHNRNKNNDVNRLLILMLASYKLGDDAAALKYVDQYISGKEKAGKGVKRYYYAIRDLLAGVPVENSADSKVAMQFLRNRKDALYACPLPTCPECGRCELHEGCRYVFLQDVERRTQAAMARNAIKQTDLSLILRNLC